MPPTSDSVVASRQALPWIVLALVAVLAIGGFFWTQRKVEALQTMAAAHQDFDAQEVKQALTTLQQTVQEVQSDQRKISEQVDGLRRKLASEGGERKLLFDQLGALSARVDGLASANANSSITAAPQAPTNKHRNARDGAR